MSPQTGFFLPILRKYSLYSSHSSTLCKRGSNKKFSFFYLNSPSSSSTEKHSYFILFYILYYKSYVLRLKTFPFFFKIKDKETIFIAAFEKRQYSYEQVVRHLCSYFVKLQVYATSKFD